MAVVASSPNLRTPSTHEQVVSRQVLGRGDNVLKPHKPLPRKRDTTISSATSPDLRAQYRSLSNGSLKENGERSELEERSSSSLMHSPTASMLPPTPPIATHESSDFSHDESSVADTTILRSRVVTPINQQSPPTPDQTPPRLEKDLVIRPWLASQPSMASTRAESYATAREEFQSDTESEHSAPHWTQSRSRNTSHHSIPVPRVPEPFRVRPSPLIDTTPRTPQAVWEDDAVWASYEAEAENEQEDRSPSPVKRTPYVEDKPSTYADEPYERPITLHETLDLDSPTLPQNVFDPPTESRDAHRSAHDVRMNGIESPSSFRSRLSRSYPNNMDNPPRHPSAEEDNLLDEEAVGDTGNFLPERSPIEVNVAPRRGPSLRERLEAVDQHTPSASTENFGEQIGWEEANGKAGKRNRRDSWRLSSGSTPSAVDAFILNPQPTRKKTIRRQIKTTSLRTASSPLPNSNRSSILTNPYGSPDSPPRHSLSHKKARVSNQNRLSYGSDVSRSLSTSSAATPSKTEVIRVAVIPERRSSRMPSEASSRRHSTSCSLTSSGRGRIPSLQNHAHTHMLSSDGASIGSRQNPEKTKRQQPQIPPRASSLSAPTSRNNSKMNSRANSITSEHLRVHRLRAENDLRKTLDRMESERVAPVEKDSTTGQEDDSDTSPLEPGSAKWASLRPPSVYDTPFSQPSVLTASGDGASIEMGEARAINLFPHNNNSLQLIEKHPLPESGAVRSLRHTSRVHDLSILIDDPPTPRAIAAEVPAMESPLRNPREPPHPPALQAISSVRKPLSSQPVTRSRSQNHPSRRYGSAGRPSLGTQRYSTSFIKSITRGLSLKHARNPKTDTLQLDPKTTPMWRPRGFWDEAEYTEDESDDYGAEESPIQNMVGLPKRRTVTTGSIGLMRSLSESIPKRKQNRERSRVLYQQRSYGSLSRLQAARKLYKVPGLRGVHFQFIGLNGWQEKMRLARNRKEDEKREERRRLLREAIGPEVVSQGDSRFLDTSANPEQVVVESRNLRIIN